MLFSLSSFYIPFKSSWSTMTLHSIYRIYYDNSDYRRRDLRKSTYSTSDDSRYPPSSVTVLLLIARRSARVERVLKRRGFGLLSSELLKLSIGCFST